MKWGGVGDPTLDTLQLETSSTIREALEALDHGSQSIVFVRDRDGRILGSITDGDIRRALLRGATLDSACLTTIMRRKFVSVPPGTGREEALDLMHAHAIGQLPVIDGDGLLVGLHAVGQLLSPVRRENQVVVLAGGRGTRLYPITESIPKPMVNVAGRPILERIVLHLMSCGFRRIHLSVNHLAHVIEEHFVDGERFGCQIRYLREEQALGTGGPVSLLDPVPTEPVVVLNGDLITQCDLGRMLEFHVRGDYVATIGVRPYALDIPFGVAEIDGGRLKRLEEKPTEQRLVNTGMYVLSPEAVGMIPKGVAYPMTDLFGACLSLGRSVGAFIVEDDWIDVGHRGELRRARGEE